MAGVSSSLTSLSPSGGHESRAGTKLATVTGGATEAMGVGEGSRGSESCPRVGREAHDQHTKNKDIVSSVSDRNICLKSIRWSSEVQGLPWLDRVAFRVVKWLRKRGYATDDCDYASNDTPKRSFADLLAQVATQRGTVEDIKDDADKEIAATNALFHAAKS